MQVSWFFMGILEKAQRMFQRYPLCNHCLGRQFALLGYGLDDKRRGEAIKTLLTMKANRLALLGEKTGVSLLKALAANGSFEMATKVLKKLRKKAGKKRQCYLCEGRFVQIPKLVSASTETLADYEYTTFLVGIKLPTRVEEREDEFKAEFEVKHGEGMRNGFSREIGKGISRITQKIAEYKTPNIVVIVNPFTEEVTIQANPLHIAGRYRKLTRGIPQSRWHCPKCRGEGCTECNWTGKLYPESVEEIISGPILEQTGGKETAFHAAGREDIDARMLGRGRPFVVEVKKPKRRFINLKTLTKTVNKQGEGKVKVANLRVADKETVRRLKKKEGAPKVYKAIIELDRDVSDEELKSLEQDLTNTMIRQQTPLRVLHRRADRVREKYIYETKLKRIKPKLMEMRIRCQGGLYIKELITGDEGRTDPNVAQLVDAKATPVRLDVLKILPRGG
jgi:tRNA pseudouridine synthase 10